MKIHTYIYVCMLIRNDRENLLSPEFVKPLWIIDKQVLYDKFLVVSIVVFLNLLEDWFLI